MIIPSAERKPEDPKEWQWHFVLWPTRISPAAVAWLQFVERRLVVDDEGNWAGGYVSHWEYRSKP